MSIPPNNPQAEAELLGALLLDGGRHILASLQRDHGLVAADFWIAAHRRTYEAITALADQGDAISTTLVVDLLSRDQEQIEDPAVTVDMLLSQAASMGEAFGHAKLLKSLTLRRTRHTAGLMLLDSADQDDELIVAEAERLLASPTVSDETTGTDAIGHEIVEWLDNTSAVGISTGFPTLDANIGGGLRPGDTTALGAWTGHGKSALVDQILTHATVFGYRCHAYINEMSRVDRGLRMIARTGAAPYSRLVVRDLTDQEMERSVKAAGRIPFGLSEVAQWDADKIARHIRSNRWDLCVFDHVHNMAYQKVSELDAIIATLCNAARSSGTHLILVCQFNEERSKQELLPMPVMRDIRGSGMLKNQCATVLLMHRMQETLEQMVLTTNNTVITAAKARHGLQGSTVSAEFVPDEMSFHPLPSIRIAA